MKKKLELSKLKNYLGTGLKYISKFDETEEFYEFDDMEGYQEAFKEGSIWEFVGFTEIEIPLGEGELSGELLKHKYGFYRGNYSSHKPLMYRLSDIDKFIPELGFVPMVELHGLGWSDSQLTLIKRYAYTHVSFEMCKKLFEWHFWPFDQSYFDERIIIDKFRP